MVLRIQHAKESVHKTVVCLPAWNIDPLEGEISVEN